MLTIFIKSFNLELIKQSLLYVESQHLLIKKIVNEKNGVPIIQELGFILLGISMQNSFIKKEKTVDEKQLSLN